MSSNALLWPSQGTKLEERLDKHKYLKLPSQGFSGGEVPPPGAPDPFLAIYPPLADTDYSRFKFYQVNKGEFNAPKADFIWEITDSVGPGVFEEASGFDIRPFLEVPTPSSISRAIATGNNFAPQFASPNTQLNCIQLSDDELHLFGWQMNTGIIHEWVLSAPHVFPPDGTPSDFQFTPVGGETNGRDIRILNNGAMMAIVGDDNRTVQLYTLPVPNSLSFTPVLIDSFDVSSIGLAAACDFSDDGMKFYIVFVNLDDMLQWNLTVPFTLPLTLSNDRLFHFNPPISLSLGNCRMFKDGTSFYIAAGTPDSINEYLTDGINDIPTVNQAPVSIFSTASLDNNTRGISVSQDRKFIWFSGVQNNTLIELQLPLFLEYEIVSVNVSTGDFTIRVKVPIIQDLTFIQIVIGNPTADDQSTTLGTGTTPSTFQTPLLTKDEDNFLVDDQGRNIVAVQS